MYNFINMHQQDSLALNPQIPPYCKQVIVHPQVPAASYTEPNLIIQQIGTQQVEQQPATTYFENEKSFQTNHTQCSDEKLKKSKRCADTSTFTIEERLVSSVWVHERSRNRISIGQIKKDFKQRFNKTPPSKNTLLVWEKKLFSTGNVMDAQRSGRPCIRKEHIDTVKASVAASPGLSLRARASALSLPRTTLRKILSDDLKFNKKSKIKSDMTGNSKRKSAVKPKKLKPSRTKTEERNKEPIENSQQEMHPQMPNHTNASYRDYSDQLASGHQFTTYAYYTGMKPTNHSNITPIPHQQYVVANMQNHRYA